MYDEAKGRAKQDGLVRGDSVQQLDAPRYDMYNL
jgi:hypothetical protein